MQNVEEMTQSLGRDLYEAVQRTTPTFGSSYWWKEKAMMWFAGDEEVRTQLLRFVDVYPVLRSAKDKKVHLQEYLFQGVSHPPFLFKLGGAMCRFDPTAGLVMAVADLGIRIMAKYFVVGPKPAEVSRAIAGLQKEGASYTLDVLGEAVLSDAEADKHMEKYIGFVEQLAALGCKPINLSVKLSGLCAQFDPLNIKSCNQARDRLRKILRVAKAKGASVTIDAEQYAYRTLVLNIFKDTFNEEEFRDFENAGIAMHTYFLDSEEKIRDIIQWARARKTPILMRLVKGAYWDWEVIAAKQKGTAIPVFAEKWQTDVSYERCTELVLENSDVVHLAVASHNYRTIAQAMAKSRAMGVPTDRLEFQVLMGMGDPLKKAIPRLGFPVCVYVPSGDVVPGMSYLVRRIIENTSQTGFLFLSIGAGLTIDKLMAIPQAAG